MLYRRRLELEIEEVRPELDIVRSATKELKVSDRFKQVLKVCILYLLASRNWIESVSDNPDDR